MKRVLHVTYALDYGGVEMHLQLVARVPEKSFEHRFAAIRAGGAAARRIGEAGGAVTILEVDPYAHPLRTVAQLVRLMRRERPDVVHTHGAEGNLFGLPAAFMARAPVRIGEEIGMPAHSARARLAYRSAFLFAHRVIGVADAVRDWMVQSGEVPARKAVQLYNPVELPSVKAEARRRGEPLRIGFVGRLEPVKNPLALVEAISALAESGLDVELVMVGDGSQRGAVDDRVRQLGIQNRVELTGFDPAPARRLARCHLYVQPSLSEGLSLALVEAMGIGLPVISTPVGGSAEVIDHGRTGWLVSTEDQSLTEAIAQAAALPADVLAEMGVAARSSVSKRFDPAAYIRDVERLYGELLSGRG